MILTYANLFCIIICLSILICDGLFPDLSIVKQMYIRSLVRILLNVPAVLLYLWFARPYMRTVPGDRKRTWYSISLVSFLFLTVFATLINFLMRDGHTVEQMILFITTMMIYCAVLWIVFGTIQHMNAEVKMELITQNVQYLQGQLAMAKEHASTAKAMRHDFRHHMQNIDLLLLAIPENSHNADMEYVLFSSDNFLIARYFVELRVLIRFTSSLFCRVFKKSISICCCCV